MTGPVSIRCHERFASSCLDIYVSLEIPALGTTILVVKLKAALVSSDGHSRSVPCERLLTSHTTPVSLTRNQPVTHRPHAAILVPEVACSGHCRLRVIVRHLAHIALLAMLQHLPISILVITDNLTVTPLRSRAPLNFDPLRRAHRSTTIHRALVLGVVLVAHSGLPALSGAAWGLRRSLTRSLDHHTRRRLAWRSGRGFAAVGSTARVSDVFGEFLEVLDNGAVGDFGPF